MAESSKIEHYRTIFISDVHLGTRGCKAELLLDFFKYHESENLYLVGDIVDGWRLKKSWYWPQAHNDVVQKILRKARKGTRVIFIPGNHDEFARDYIGTHFGGIELRLDDEFESANGKKYLIIHGDAFDGVIRHAKWLAHLGDWAYSAALGANTILAFVRRKLGFSYWSLSAYLKSKVKNAVKFVDDFEGAVANEAKRRGLQGCIAGHIHKAAIKDVEGITYMNDGDWVESCTALVETFDGQFKIIDWSHRLGSSKTSNSPKSISAAA
ncbi:MAG: UDP-2,3-diacylglucosamine diphosphatase [Alphaproteobacteria bacterium]